MSPTCSNVPPVLPATLPGPGLYQRFGPGLWSLVIHLGVVLLLALWTLGTGSERGDRLELSTTEDLDLTNSEELVATEVDAQLAQQVSVSVGEFAPAVLEVADAPPNVTVAAVEIEPAVENLLPTFGEGAEGIREGKGRGRDRSLFTCLIARAV